MIFHQHISSGDLHIPDKHKTIVLGRKSLLGPNISHLHALKRLEGDRITNGDQEGVKSLALLVDDQLSKKGRMSAVNS